jgi:mycothione reductase
MIKDSNNFDLIVIGSGSGLDVANAAAKTGLSVALIEKDRMGGTCLNRGCIPSKLLIHSADVLELIRQCETFGITIRGKVLIDFEKIVSRVISIVDSHSEEIKEAYNRVNNPRVFYNECMFIGSKELLLKGIDTFPPSGRITGQGNKRHSYSRNAGNQRITGRKVLIASGSRPRIPKIKGLNVSGFITSDQALRLKKQPVNLTIIGGGYICCELAHFFGSLGTKINIIQIQNKLIPNEDEDISKKLTDLFSKKYNVYLGYFTELVSKVNNPNRVTLENNSEITGSDNSKIYRVTAKNNESGSTIKVESDQLLIAVGRIPNSDTLDLGKTGVKLDERGYVLTDEFLQTNIQDIYSLGDVVGRYTFKHSANLEALYAIHNIIHGQDKIPVDYAAIPHAIFTSPQIAAVGVTEQSLKQQGKKENKDYLKSIYPFINTGMGLAIEDHEGFVKFLVDKESRKILGCHIIGTDAPVLIHEVAVAMKTSDSMGNVGTIDNINRAVHVHPALSEVVARAASQI